jgi:hypothetical protein
MSGRILFTGLARVLSSFPHVTSEQAQFAIKQNALALRECWVWSSTSLCSLRANGGVVNLSSLYDGKHSLNRPLFVLTGRDVKLVEHEQEQECAALTRVATSTHTRKWLDYRPWVLVPQQAISDYMAQTRDSGLTEDQP